MCYYEFYFFSVKTKHKVDPRRQSVEVGESVTFICYSDGDVTWSFEGHDLPSNARKSNYYTKHALHIYNVQKDNFGVYKCRGELLALAHNGVDFFVFEEGGLLELASKYYHYHEYEM